MRFKKNKKIPGNFLWEMKVINNDTIHIIIINNNNDDENK